MMAKERSKDDKAALSKFLRDLSGFDGTELSGNESSKKPDEKVPDEKEADEKEVDEKANPTAPVTPYGIFEKCIIRAQNLISFEASTGSVEEISDEHYCDCYRAAIVLTISALDAYVRKVVISEIKKIVSDPKTTLTGDLKDYVKNLLNSDKLLEAARKYDLIEKLEKAIINDFSTKSFQGDWKITKYLKLIGHENIFSTVSESADINERNLITSINKFTNRRHIIAHSGDYNLNIVPHSENEITKKYADECIRVIQLFALTLNDILEK